MTTIHVEEVGNRALIDRAELNKLLELARRTEDIQLEISDDEITTRDLMRLADAGGAFDWLRDEPDLYCGSRFEGALTS